MKHNNTLRIKLTPIQALSQKNEVFDWRKFISKERKEVPKFKFQMGGLVKTAEKRIFFSKGDTTG